MSENKIMTIHEELEKQLAALWIATAEKRKKTHTRKIYEKYLETSNHGV